MVKKLNLLLPSLFLKHTKNKGRGVFTREAIAAATVIEIAPVIVMSAADRVLIDQTLLHDYIFEWGAEGKGCCMALGFIPLYNHAAPSNCEYEMDFKREIISVHTVRDIKAGEELFINYNGDWDSDKHVWFEMK